VHTQLFFFFLHLSLAHRALPSFPTRRSSDLTGFRAECCRTPFTRGHDAERFPADPADIDAVCLQRVHDFCVVRPSQIQATSAIRSEEHTSELQSPYDLVCRLLLEKKNTIST